MFGNEVRTFSEDEKNEILNGTKRWGRWRYQEVDEEGGCIAHLSDEYYSDKKMREEGKCPCKDGWCRCDRKWTEDDYVYEILLSDIDTEEKVGIWVLHLAGKDSFKKEDIGDLIDMLMELYYFGIFVLSSIQERGRCKALWCCNRTEGEYCENHKKKV